MQHVLIVDDDTKIRNLIMDYLSQHAFKVSGAGNSQEMTRIAAAESVDILVVDLNLGREDGLEVVRDFSASSDATIIIITGDRLDEADKVVGLELGASDYITKPFGMREFLARIKASVRQKPVVNASRDTGTYLFAGWSLNMRYRRLTNPSAQEVRLTGAEFNLLAAFLDAPCRILSREQLLASSRLFDEEVFDRSIDVLILRLRRKLESNPSSPRLIKTERGAGYILDVDVKVEDRHRVY